MKEHRRIYEQHYGPIPKGYHIHHKDGNHSNNHPSNLECLTGKEHFERHLEQGDYGACWALMVMGHVRLTPEERSEISRKQLQYQWREHREKMLAGRRKRDPKDLIGRTWKLSPEKAAKVRQHITPFTSETADVCSGTIWINDGKRNKRIRGEIPDGWVKGRLFVPHNKKQRSS